MPQAIQQPADQGECVPTSNATTLAGNCRNTLTSDSFAVVRRIGDQYERGRSLTLPSITMIVTVEPEMVW